MLPGFICGHSHITGGTTTRGLIEQGRMFHRPFEVAAALSAEEVADLGGIREMQGRPARLWAYADGEAAFRERREEILEALLQLMEERHARFNATIYQLEPDIKDSPGGLRDIAAARVFLSLAEAPDGGNAIEHDRLEQAEDFLLRIRSMLHLDNGRNVNTGAELELVAPARARTGRRFEITVYAYDSAGRRTPAANARIFGLVGEATTDARGKAAIIASGEGGLRLRAARGPDVPSAPVRVCIREVLSRCPAVRGQRIYGTSLRREAETVRGEDGTR